MRPGSLSLVAFCFQGRLSNSFLSRPTANVRARYNRKTFETVLSYYIAQTYTYVRRLRTLFIRPRDYRGRAAQTALTQADEMRKGSPVKSHFWFGWRRPSHDVVGHHRRRKKERKKKQILFLVGFKFGMKSTRISYTFFSFLSLRVSRGLKRDPENFVLKNIWF